MGVEWSCMLNVYIDKHHGLESVDALQSFSWPFPLNWCPYAENLAVGEVFVTGSGVGLVSPDGQKPLYFSWEENLRAWQREKRALLLSNPLLKAIGKKGQGGVVDATVGLGKDSSMLLCCGHEVYGYERQEKVFFLQKASQILESFLPEKLFLHFGVVKENPENLPIFFDPMFDDGKKRKALPNKGMALFHEVVGGDEDALSEAQRLKALTSRLVIKRAPKAPQLLEKRNSAWESKAVRFDLYL